MPLLTLQTRLVTLLATAQDVRAESGRLASLLTTPTSVLQIVKIGVWAQGIIDDTITPAQADTSLATYAATQFDDPNFGLSDRLAGVKYLLSQVVTTAQTIAPYDLRDNIWEDVWRVDDVGVYVPRMTPDQTSILAGQLQTIHDAIPE